MQVRRVPSRPRSVEKRRTGFVNRRARCMSVRGLHAPVAQQIERRCPTPWGPRCESWREQRAKQRCDSAPCLGTRRLVSRPRPCCLSPSDGFRFCKPEVRVRLPAEAFKLLSFNREDNGLRSRRRQCDSGREHSRRVSREQDEEAQGRLRRGERKAQLREVRQADQAEARQPEAGSPETLLPPLSRVQRSRKDTETRVNKNGL